MKKVMVTLVMVLMVASNAFAGITDEIRGIICDYQKDMIAVAFKAKDGGLSKYEARSVMIDISRKHAAKHPPENKMDAVFQNAMLQVSLQAVNAVYNADISKSQRDWFEATVYNACMTAPID